MRKFLLFIIFIATAYISNAQGPVVETIRTYMKQTRFDEALDFIQEHLDKNPHAAEVYYERAKIYSRLGKQDLEQRDLDLAFYYNPILRLQVDKHQLINHINKKEYNYDWITNESNAAFNKSISKQSYYEQCIRDQRLTHVEDSIIIRTLTFIENRDYTEAEELISKIEDQKNALIFDIKGLIAIGRGDLILAENYFSKAINEIPYFAMAFHNRSLVRKMLGKYDLAKEDLQSAIDINSDYALFYFSKALLFQRIGMDSDAVLYYQKALSQEKGFKEASTNYASLLKDLGQYESAIAELTKAAQSSEQEIENHFLLGNLNLIYGEYETAIDNFNTFLKVNPTDQDAQYNLALGTILSGEIDDGCKLLDELNNFVRSENFLAQKICNYSD